MTQTIKCSRVVLYFGISGNIYNNMVLRQIQCFRFSVVDEENTIQNWHINIQIDAYAFIEHI